jgi:hypothetical protein
MVLLCAVLLCAVHNADVYDWFVGGLYCSWIYCDADSFCRSKNVICFDSVSLKCLCCHVVCTVVTGHILYRNFGGLIVGAQDQDRWRALVNVVMNLWIL